MDVFKLRISDKHFYQLNKDSFEEETNKSDPWYQEGVGIEGESHFAICPSCHNTTQIIGLNQAPDEDKPVYARHYLRKTIAGLGVVDQDAYDSCPRANLNKSLDKNAKRNDQSKIGLQIKMLLIEEFDRVIYLLNKQIPVRLSPSTVKSMLEYYKQEKGWLYRGATLDNIPWTFAYMTKSYHLFGKIIQDEVLRQKLQSKYPYIYFDEKYVLRRKDTSKEFFDVTFCFIHHKRKVDDHKLTESIVFLVSDGRQNNIYRKVIDFDHAYFCNLIAKEDQSYRNQYWLELCSSILN
ncbi:hypothetical protein [Cysteiniphilum litorale]|uniref:hypothetical protein n=1 Tax=Cysteiniphilum litorale TaxID=2056700 RepID=UPI003F882C3F